MMAENGPKGLLRGLGPRILAMAPASVLIVSVYELIKRLSRKTPLEATTPPPPPPPRTTTGTRTTTATTTLTALGDADRR